MKLTMRLGSYLQDHNLTAYKLEKAVNGVVSRNTVYKWARETSPPEHLHTAQFLAVMQALERLTGQPVTPNDLLEVIEEPVEETIPEEAWLADSALSLKAALIELEANEDPAQVRQWTAAFQQVAL